MRGAPITPAAGLGLEPKDMAQTKAHLHSFHLCYLVCVPLAEPVKRF